MKEEEKKKHKRDTSIEYRGTVLHHMANLEFFINKFLAQYFCGNDEIKSKKIINLLFGDDRITLGAKSQVFHYIVTTEYKTWYNLYKPVRKPDNKKDNISMTGDLDYVIKERNVFAHRLFDTGSAIEDIPLDEDKIRFAKFKNKAEPIDYDMKTYSVLLLTILELSIYIAKLIESIENTQPPSA